MLPHSFFLSVPFPTGLDASFRAEARFYILMEGNSSPTASVLLTGFFTSTRRAANTIFTSSSYLLLCVYHLAS